MSQTRRQYAEAIVCEVIAAYTGDDERELRRLIREEYPWGARSNWPYKVWLSVVKELVDAWRRRVHPDTSPPTEGLFEVAD